MKFYLCHRHVLCIPIFSRPIRYRPERLEPNAASSRRRGDEAAKTGWIRAEAAENPEPW